MLKDFKEFIARGNVMDMAIGIIIGGAFGKIVTSLVNDIVMPPIGLLLGNVDFSNLFINLSSSNYKTLAEAAEAGAPTINYGQFINITLEFLIIAFAIFIMMKAINNLKKEPPPAPPNTKDCPHCLSKVPAKATRCPNCTSQLDEKAA